MKKIVKVLCCIIVGTLLLCIMLTKRVEIKGYSMEPTLKDGEVALMRKILSVDNIKRNQIIIAKDPYNEKNNIIKRVIGLPKETIYCMDGEVYVNDTKLDDINQIDKTTENFGPIKIGENQYFVLGDNRNSSTDSRVFGTIDKSKIIGVFIKEL